MEYLKEIGNKNINEITIELLHHILYAKLEDCLAIQTFHHSIPKRSINFHFLKSKQTPKIMYLFKIKIHNKIFKDLNLIDVFNPDDFDKYEVSLDSKYNSAFNKF